MASALILAGPAHADEGWPGLANGDLIVQDRPGPLSDPLKRAGATRFTHIGIVRPTGGGFYVADATPENGVFELPIDQFLAKGQGGLYWVFRHQGLPTPPDENHPAVTAAYANHYMEDFDSFYLPGDSQHYGAEFIRVIYGENGVDLGSMQSLKSLGLATEADLGALFGQWQDHPVCVDAALAGAACRDMLLDFEIVTPASIAGDDDLTLVFTNASD